MPFPTSWNSHYNELLWRWGTASPTNDKVISNGRGRMHLRGAGHGSPGMTRSCFRRSADTGPQNHPFQTGVALTPWGEKARLPFCLLVSTVLVLFCSRPCSLQSLGVFDSVAPIFLYLLPAGIGRGSPSSPQHTPEWWHTQLDEVTCFDNCAVHSHSCPAQTCTASFSWGSCSFWALKSHWVFLFCLIYRSACLQVPTDSDICF